MKSIVTVISSLFAATAFAAPEGALLNQQGFAYDAAIIRLIDGNTMVLAAAHAAAPVVAPATAPAAPAKADAKPAKSEAAPATKTEAKAATPAATTAPATK